MAKNKGTATPSKVQRQREAAEALKGGSEIGNARELLATIEAEEQEQFAEFERKLKEQREKKLGAILDPLNKRREELAQTVTDAEAEIAEIDRQVASLTGQKQRKGKGKGGGGGGRVRRSAEQLQAQAAEVVAFIKQHKDGVKAGAIKEKFGDLLPSVKQFLVKNAPDAKVKTEGERAATVYSV